MAKLNVTDKIELRAEIEEKMEDCRYYGSNSINQPLFIEQMLILFERRMQTIIEREKVNG